MTQATDRNDAASGIEGVLLANRDSILRFLRLRGAGDTAEDLFQDLWMRLTEKRTGQNADTLAYEMRAANKLMLERFPCGPHLPLRGQAWGEDGVVRKPR